LRPARGAVIAMGISLLAAAVALADDAFKPPPDSYPANWNLKTAPTPQVYDYDVGTGSTALKATGQLPVPPPQNARIIYQMVPGGLRYHRVE
jgi:hypothetical protein